MTRPSSTRGLWSVIVPAYLLLLWVVASAWSRLHGGVTCLAGLMVLVAGIAALRRGRPRLLYTACFLMLMAGACAGGLELLLRLAPNVIGGGPASAAYTGYHWYRGGIYRLDLHRGPVMKPDFHREMYWSGHWWHHDANRDGYRGPALARADAVFLGDSMVYGHGVEQQDTLPSRFEERTALATANLGQQGTGILQCLATFREIGLRLKPRFVFVCVHPTDIEDALELYAASELRGFVDEGRWPLTVREKYRPRPSWDLLDLWAVRLALPLRCSALPGAVFRVARDRLGGEAPAPRTEGHWEPSPEAVAGPHVAFGPEATDDLRLAWAATRRALAEIKRLGDQAGARVVLFDIGYPQDLSREVAATARELGAEYSPAGAAALRLASSGVEIYLADDGHWSPTGNAVVARELARAVEGPAATRPPAE